MVYFVMPQGPETTKYNSVKKGWLTWEMPYEDKCLKELFWLINNNVLNLTTYINSYKVQGK